MVHLTSLTVLPFLALATASLIVNVPSQGTYTGTTINSSGLRQQVSAWLGIEYSTQPVGFYRFNHVPPPAPFTGTKNASAFGKICPQDNTNAPYKDWAMGEDCLTLNIFRPANVSLYQKLPVAFYIHGGAFVSGAARNYNAKSFVSASKNPIMMVTINYRLGPLGSLPSSETAEAGLLNLGLVDQVNALEWVSRNIGYFGGDRDQITLFGLSAGAHSIGFNLLNKVQNVAPLFKRVIMNSGSPTSRAYPKPDNPLLEEQYAKFIGKVGCGGEKFAGKKRWECLRGVDAEVVRKAGVEVLAAYFWQTSFPFQPAMTGPLIPRPPTLSWTTGNFYHLPILTGSQSNEGSMFVPRNLSTNTQFTAFFRTLLSNLTSTHLSELQTLYPDPVTSPETSPFTNSPFSPQFSRLSAAYGDYAYICQVQETALRASAQGVKVWKYHFAQNNSFPYELGIPHTGDVPFQVNSSSAITTGPGAKGARTVAEVYSGWLSNFVASGDPNDGAGEEVPVWPVYRDGSGDDSERRQMKLGPEGQVGVESEGAAVRERQCEFWRGVAGELFH